jgi:hypothetical protein
MYVVMLTYLTTSHHYHTILTTSPYISHHLTISP